MSKKLENNVWNTLSEEDLKAIEKQLHTVVTSNNTNTISTNYPFGGGTTYPSTTYPTYPNQYPGTGQPQIFPPPSPSKFSLEMDDPEIVDLIELLEVEPCTPEAHGIILRINQVDYSLTSILKAQMTYMVKMNLLLIHRGLATETP